MIPLGLFGTIGPQELLLFLLILVVLFGARKIPELARGLGEGIRNFRSSMKEETDKKDEENKGSESSDR